MASLPPPPPINGTPNSSTLTTVLTNKEKKALAAVKLKEINLTWIKEANKNMNSFDPNHTMFTSPMLKPFIPLESTTSSNKTFTNGAYVEVAANTIAGMNRPMGCGYIIKLHSIKSKPVADVKYTMAYDGDRTFKSIPLTALTIANLNQDTIMATSKQKRVQDEAEREETVHVVATHVTKGQRRRYLSSY